MTTSDELRVTCQLSRERVHRVQDLRIEQRRITARSALRVAQSRALLDRAFARAQVMSVHVPRARGWLGVTSGS